MDSSLRYNPALDGLRAIAAMLVVTDHCRVPGFNPGYFGVDLFFVLSGFLITRLLVDELDSQDRIDLPRFYLRRFLRLAPPLLLLLVAYLALAPMAWPQFSFKEHLRDAGVTGFYLSDYAMAFWHYPKALQHSWSLSVEEKFYFIWPFAVLLLARIEPRWRIAGLFGIYLLATAWRIFEYGHSGWTATYFRFDTRGRIGYRRTTRDVASSHGPNLGQDRQHRRHSRVHGPRCLPFDRPLAWPLVFGVADKSGRGGCRGFVDLGFGTKLVGEYDAVGAAACCRRHYLLRRISVALSRCGLLQGLPSLVPDLADHSDSYVRRSNGQLSGRGTAAAAFSSES